VVGQSVEQGCSKSRVAKYIHPPGKLQVGSDDETALLIALGDELKHQLAALTKRYIAKFVQDDEIVLIPAPQKAGQGENMADFIPISHDEILKEANRFREWSSPSLLKLFYSDDELPLVQQCIQSPVQPLKMA
jgi:hypothetical protein